eukprot:scpid40212/ scgid2498/ Acyl-CoA synthetase family member 3, mitochondrial
MACCGLLRPSASRQIWAQAALTRSVSTAPCSTSSTPSHQRAVSHVYQCSSSHRSPGYARYCATSAASSFPLHGPLSSPLHRIVERSGSPDLAIFDSVSGAASYQLIYSHADALTQSLCSCLGSAAAVTNDGPPIIGVLCSNSYMYVAAQWACWSLGYVFMPLCSQHPTKMMEYFLDDSSAKALLFDTPHKAAASQLTEKFSIPAVEINEAIKAFPSGAEDTPSWSPSVSEWADYPATLFYTSGTTGPPKGVPVTHGNLRAGVRSIGDAWQISARDCILHCLPLHHVHGVVNALTVPLSLGASVNMLPRFDAEKVWTGLLGVPMQRIKDNVSATAQPSNARPSVFMAVPTMYAKLIKYAADCQLSQSEKADVAARCKELRVMISGSAPLPDPILQAWQDLTGHRLLERYGMTEIGMGLTNPLHGDRLAGAVGQPFPGVEARIMSSDSEVMVEGTSVAVSTMPGYAGEQGELQVRGPSVFPGYWRKPEATKKSFTADGWFLTGDTAVYENSVFRIVGRTSVDIIKFGGYKISALDVERCLLAHPSIADCAVIGLPDTTYGEVVTAIVVANTTPGAQDSLAIPSLEDLAEFLKKSLPPYQAPRRMHIAPELPRNAMGKVNKKELAKFVLDGKYDCH